MECPYVMSHMGSVYVAHTGGARICIRPSSQSVKESHIKWGENQEFSFPEFFLPRHSTGLRKSPDFSPLVVV